MKILLTDLILFILKYIGFIYDHDVRVKLRLIKTKKRIYWSCTPFLIFGT